MRYKLLPLLLAALVSAGAVAPASAAIDFAFSFTNVGNGGGTVEGIIRGLEDNTTGPATSVEVTGNTLGFGLGEYVGNPDVNFFTLSGGDVAFFNFVARGAANTSPAVTCCTLGLFSPASGGLAQDPNAGSTHPSSGLTLTRIGVIPLPAPALLLVAALAALAGVGRLGRRAPAA